MILKGLGVEYAILLVAALVHGVSDMSASGRQPRNSASALLDELMGQERNLDLASKAKKRFWEGDVCKFYLCGLSPYHVLKGTKGYAMMGVDKWVRHAYSVSLQRETPETIDVTKFVCDVTLRAQYEVLSAEEKAKFGYERLLYDCLCSLVRQCDKRVSNNQEKISQVGDISEETMKRIAELEAAYKAKIDESERLGEVGEIEESMKLVAEAEAVKADKASLEASLITNEHGKRFIVCQTTGDLIESAAAADDAWMASHFESEDYQGWKTLRDWHARLGALRDGRGPSRGVPGYSGDDGVVQEAPSSSRRRRDGDERQSRHRHTRRRRDTDADVEIYRYRDDESDDVNFRSYSRRRDEDYYSRRDDADYRRRRDRSRSRERRRDIYRAPDRRRDRAESPGEA